MRVPRWPIVILVLLVGAAGGIYWLLRPPPGITVASWGDAYGRAQMVALFHPYTDETGVGVDATLHDGGLGELRTQVESGAVRWDVVDFDLADAMAACREGLLERIDDLALPPGADGARAAADFVPGALGPCWVGTSVYSHMVAYDPRRFPEPPTRLADFFDLERFPGPRALRDAGPMSVLEMALLADGAGVQNVYPLLRTPEGVDRAFRKLDGIRSAIVWWRRPNEPVDWIARGDVAMAAALNGRVFEAVTSGRNVAAFWDGQLYQMDVFVIPRGSANRRLARDFIRFATAPEPMARQAHWLPFGPARRSAAVLVGSHPESGIAMRPFLPTAPENFRNAFAVNPEWWDLHGEAIRARWADWRGE